MRISIFLLCLLVAGGASAQRQYVCYYTPERITIDGMDREGVWQKARWTDDFVDIEGDVKPKPTFRTRTKMLWDHENLYIYAELQEPDLWGSLTKHDTIIYHDNDFEVFIDPNNDTHNYFEIEINALGTVFDLFMNKPYRNEGQALMTWDTRGLRSAVRMQGTLNKPGDVDKSWSVEMAIPLESLWLLGDQRLGDSSLLRINFSRVEWDRDVAGGKYVPRVNGATGRRLPEHNWVWSPQGVINMHYPEKWGYLLLTSRRAGEDTVALVLPEAEKARTYLWDVYYRQQEYRSKHEGYAKDLETLGLSGVVQDEKGQSFRREMEATSRQFTVLMTGSSFQGVIGIDQDGKVVSRIGKN